MTPDHKYWTEAARPKTLPAAAVPVLTGAALAWSEHLFDPLASFIALFCAITIQIGTNFANDYYDHVHGADTDQRIGFRRLTSSGVIPPSTMLFATRLTFLVAFLAGLWLVWIGGWIILLIGLLSILFGFLYTAGPLPLGYNGLGDLFVFLFFGCIAVSGTYYVNALQWSVEALWLSVPVGALCVNILVVNNLRDIDQDRISGKRTLGVLFGERALQAEYIVMIILSYSILPMLHHYFNFHTAIYLPLLTLPFASILTYRVWNHQNKESLNKVLVQTALLMLIFGLLLATGTLFRGIE
ncbi:MAG: 1,4-dihydroxy-2-naphthoate polyprenyltransferase [Balneolaceae bacterium]